MARLDPLTATKDDILAEMVPVIVEQLGCEATDVVLTAAFKEDLNADSLDLAELIMSLEDVFGVGIDDKEAELLATVGDVVDYLDARRDTWNTQVDSPQSEAKSAGVAEAPPAV